MSALHPKEIELDAPAVGAERPINNNQVKAAEPVPSRPVLKAMDDATSLKNAFMGIFAALVIVVAGVVTGFGLQKVMGKAGNTGTVNTSGQVSKDSLAVGDVIGSKEDSFKDSAEGVLVKGGIDGEGSHHLMRPGGISQNVYLTSSVLDLDLLENHKVKVWGETFGAQKAGWLMDVGRAEVVELNAEKPFEEDVANSGNDDQPE